MMPAVLGVVAGLVVAAAYTHVHAQAPQASCVVGPPNAGTNIQVEGDAAAVAQACRDFTTSSFNGRSYQRLSAPSGDVRCRYQVDSVRYTVRDGADSPSAPLDTLYCSLFAQERGARKV